MGPDAAGSSGQLGEPISGTVPSCATPAERRRLDLYLMIDNNITLPDPRAWAGVLQGVTRYVNDPRSAGTGVGVDYFGLDCNEGSYAMPTVGVAPLPDNARAIAVSFVSVLPINVSPILPALSGALRHASSLANSFDHRVAVVLITDGFQDLMCGSDVAGGIAEARDAFQATPSIPTYVVGADSQSLLLPNASPATRFGPLDQIAAAGGTGQTRLVDVIQETALGGTQTSPFANTMVTIQRDAEPCDYALIDGVVENPDEIVLGFSPVGPIDRLLLRVADRGGCSTGGGYYFTLDPSGQPIWASLCPVTCEDIESSPAPLYWFGGC
jgi:hypothetical protein